MQPLLMMFIFGCISFPTCMLQVCFSCFLDPCLPRSKYVFHISGPRLKAVSMVFEILAHDQFLLSAVCRRMQEQNFATFADDIGGSERLFKTPIPLSYTRLTSRFLFLYHIFLPFALWDTMGWLTIPVTILHTAVFFCIEEVGVLIENPFPILALDVIAASARNNVAVSLSFYATFRAPSSDHWNQTIGALTMNRERIQGWRTRGMLLRCPFGLALRALLKSRKHTGEEELA